MPAISEIKSQAVRLVTGVHTSSAGGHGMQYYNLLSVNFALDTLSSRGCYLLFSVKCNVSDSTVKTCIPLYQRSSIVRVNLVFKKSDKLYIFFFKRTTTFVYV